MCPVEVSTSTTPFFPMQTIKTCSVISLRYRVQVQRSLRFFSSETLKIPDRESHIDRMKSTKEFDVLVIGGGATGAGFNYYL
jgi:hypothetical protein